MNHLCFHRNIAITYTFKILLFFTVVETHLEDCDTNTSHHKCVLVVE